MANRANAPFGFKPIEPLLHVGYYPVTAAGANIFVGDLISMVSTGDVDRAGVAGDIADIIGAVTQCFNSVGSPITYLPSGDTGYVTVADDPNQYFVVQEDADTTPMTLADRGACINAEDTETGNTTTGLSGMEIDSDDVDQLATTDCTIIRQYDELNDTISATADTSHVRWVVKINAHMLANATIGV